METKIGALTNSTYQWKSVGIYFGDVQIGYYFGIWHRMQIKMISFQNTRQNIHVHFSTNILITPVFPHRFPAAAYDAVWRQGVRLPLPYGFSLASHLPWVKYELFPSVHRAKKPCIT